MELLEGIRGRDWNLESGLYILDSRFKILNSKFYFNMKRTKLDFHYTKAKSKDLEKRSFSGKKEDNFLRNCVNKVDKLVFKNPVETLAFLILGIALPISIIIAIRTREEVDIRKLSADIEVRSSEIEDVVSASEFDFSITAKGTNVKELEFVDVSLPEGITPSREVQDEIAENVFQKERSYGGEKVSKDGVFAVLTKGESKSDLICKGCDSESKNAYLLTEFNVVPSDEENQPVWGRNPVANKDTNKCVKFPDKKFVSSSWKYYESEKKCIESELPPEIKSELKNEKISFSFNCEGKPKYDYQTFEQVVSATDSDGELVRFSVESKDDFIKVKQDSIENVINEVSSKEAFEYESFQYTARLEGKIGKDRIGETLPIKLSACNMDGSCKESEFSVQVIQRSGCSFTLPETGGELTMSVDNPNGKKPVSGESDIVVAMEGAKRYDFEVKLYEKSCEESENYVGSVLKKKDYKFDGKGFTFELDSRKYDDGKYCLYAVSRNSKLDPAGSNWTKSDEVYITLQSSNRDPVITSTPPNTNLVTGDRFEYKLEARDPDGHKINYDFIGYPKWLKVSGRTIAGSTNVPGTYTLVAFVDDNHEGFDAQIITINVSPPQNTKSTIRFIYPTSGSVLSGGSNDIRWEATDPDGIKSISLYYSRDGETWRLIGNFGGSARSVNWDVSSLSGGQYYLRLVVVDNSSRNVQTAAVSDPFYISNSGKVPIDDKDKKDDEDKGDKDKKIDIGDTSMPSINNLTPVPDSETYSVKPLISASLHPSNKAKIVTDEVNVWLDDKDITDLCQISRPEVVCELESDLAYGEHKVRIDVVDSKDKQMTEEWLFTVVEEVEDQEEEEVSEDTITIPGLGVEVERGAVIVSAILCVVALFLILIPWIIYYIWNKRNVPPETVKPQESYLAPDSGHPSQPSGGNQLYTPDYGAGYASPPVEPTSSPASSRSASQSSGLDASQNETPQSPPLPKAE